MDSIEKLNASHGLGWVTMGWSIFRREPGMLVLLFLFFILAVFLAGILPIIGQLLAPLITPVLSGGLLLAVETTASGQRPRFAHLFAGFTDPSRRGRLLTLGLWSLVINVLAILAVMVSGGSFLLGLIGLGMMAAPPVAQAGAGFGLLTLLLAVAIVLIYAAALFFATPLVMLSGMEPLAALKLSLAANLRNLGAWLVFGLIYLALGIIATIPLGLGLLILGPMSVASTYCAYKDTFSRTPEKPGITASN